MKKISSSKSLKHQQGLSLIGWIVVMVVASFCGLFLFRVVPMYAENTYVQQALKSLADGGVKVSEMTDAEIKKQIINFYTINNVRSEGPQHIEIDRKSKNMIIKIDYELRENLFRNIDVVTQFKNHLDANNPQLCCKPADEK